MEKEEGRQIEKESKEKKHVDFLTYCRRKRGLGLPDLSVLCPI